MGTVSGFTGVLNTQDEEKLDEEEDEDEEEEEDEDEDKNETDFCKDNGGFQRQTLRARNYANRRINNPFNQAA